MEEDELYKDSPLKGLLAQMARSSKGEKKVPFLTSFQKANENLSFKFPFRNNL